MEQEARDRKCDGYPGSTDSVFQVYAPARIELESWLTTASRPA
jgi:hypothetical protein